jgi:hypothetical protein
MIETPETRCSFDLRPTEKPSQSCRPSLRPVKSAAGRTARSFVEGSA